MEVMKIIPILVLLFAACVSNTITHTDSSDPIVVDQIDLNKYSGTWYEIGRYPTFFQRNCIQSTAEYQVQSDKSLSVHNICYKKDGSTSDIKGTANIVDSATPAKLKVRFNIFAQGEYWIISLDKNYKWVVVSSSKKNTLFILARTAPIESNLKNSILADLKSRGFEIDKIIYDQY